MARITDTWLEQAIREAHGSWPDALAGRQIDIIGKSKSLLKFGRNRSLSSGTQATIWDVGVEHETYVVDNTNPIDAISSSSASDTNTVSIEGHVDDGAGNKTFCVVVGDLDGQTEVDLSTFSPVVGHAAFQAAGGFNRVSRMAPVSNDPDPFVGDVYVYQSGQTVTSGVPQDLTLTHLKASGTVGLSKTNKCASTISQDDVYIVTSVRVGVQRQSQAVVDFALERSTNGGSVFQEIAVGASARDSGMAQMFGTPPYLILPPNSDFRVVATSSANSAVGFATVNGVLGRLI